MISKKPNRTLLIETRKLEMEIKLLAILILATFSGTFAEQCGRQAEDALCPNNLCCSKWGFCGSTDAYCKEGCQSQCGGGVGIVNGVQAVLSSSQFEQMLLHRNDAACPARGFYTYQAFVTAANSFPSFAATGSSITQKREIAAFLAQTSQETTGGWPTAPDGPYAWGYCYKEEQRRPSNYCKENNRWPCVPGKSYHGRGPIQLSYNYNYGQAGDALGYNLLSNPELVASDVTISFKTALWFWMTPQSPKPSCHDVITGNWRPSPADRAAGRVPGYGVITNIVNGGVECGHGFDQKVANRIGFYKRYCDMLGISYGDNLDCYNQRPFGSGGMVGNTYVE